MVGGGFGARVLTFACVRRDDLSFPPAMDSIRRSLGLNAATSITFISAAALQRQRRRRGVMGIYSGIRARVTSYLAVIIALLSRELNVVIEEAVVQNREYRISGGEQ